MTRDATFSARRSGANPRVPIVIGVLGLLVLGAALGLALPARGAGEPGGAGGFPDGAFVCPSSGNGSVSIYTNTTEGPAPLTVQFCSYSPHPVRATLWWFGDGNTSTLANVSHTFTLSGTYTVALNVTFGTGGFGWSEASIVVTGGGNGTGSGGNGTGSGGGNGTGSGGGNGTGSGGGGSNSTNGSGPLDVVAGAHPTSGVAPAVINFYANASGGTPPYSYFWTFGNGGNGTGATPTYVYDTPGTFYASVYVRDSTGLDVNATVTITITGNQSGGSPLHLNFTAVPDRGTAPLNVIFYAYAYGGSAPYAYHICPFTGNCSVVPRNWTSNGSAVATAYLTPGNYTATAVVVDSAGSEAIATTPIVVLAGPALHLTVLASSLSGPAPLAVGFLANVSGGTAPYAIEWNWGDGSVGSSASGAVVAHAYTAAGIYRPNLTVSDAAGHSVTVDLGIVNVTAVPAVSAARPSGLLPSGGTPLAIGEYLGIAAVGAVVSGVGVGLLLRRRRRQKEAASLVSALETTASRDPAGPNGRESER